MPREHTVLICKARHPLAERYSVFTEQVHGVKLSVFAGPAVPTGRVLLSPEDLTLGHVAVWCAKCRLYTEYRVTVLQTSAAA